MATELSTPTTPMPTSGRSREEVLELLDQISVDDLRWREGRHQGWVYWPGDEAAEVIEEAVRRFHFSNPLLARPFPSLQRVQADLLAIVSELLNAPAADGIVTTGGTESNLLAVWTALQRARRSGSLTSSPSIVIPFSAHPSFNKAAAYFGCEAVRVPTGPDYAADPVATEAAITADTILLVGSAPGYAHGIVDPVGALGAIAQQRKLPLHIDGCLGGLILPFVERLGRPVPEWDFRVPGVTSVSADLHKHGYSPKGASVLLVRDPELAAGGEFYFDGWPNGRYQTLTITGSRSGSALAGAWAALQFLGIDGFVALTQQVMDWTDRFQAAINEQPTLSVIGSPPANKFAYTSDGGDIVAVADALEERGWYVMRQATPEAIGMQVATYHGDAVEPYAADLAASVDEVVNGGRRRGTTRASYN
jgi:glutamate/tyrosine decarboxylase-like PLP-dependent enzyme